VAIGGCRCRFGYAAVHAVSACTGLVDVESEGDSKHDAIVLTRLFLSTAAFSIHDTQK
jgi:hypothetical protein